MKNFIKILVVGLCAFAVTVTAYSFNYSNYRNGENPKKAAINSTYQNSESLKQGGMKVRLLEGEAEKQYLDSWKQNQDVFPSVDEINKALPFKIKLPKVNITGQPTIYASKNKEPDKVTITVFYRGGLNNLHMVIFKTAEVIDYYQTVKEMEDDIKNDICKVDQPPKVVSVNGMTGWGIEPGYNIVNGEKSPRPGFVSWSDNMIQYTIYGTPGEKGHSLEQLLKMASSTYET
ncbi:MAG: hypothetical protein CVV03_07660 [Firmicutes bacterium HGW-Firmicutes-8]|nr:MAG: hypothetical protein CVV03_07660 [Firmicutes bacterium HGW-Firmicutes-8]